MKGRSHGFRGHSIVLCGLLSLGVVIATEWLALAEQRYSITDLKDLGGGVSYAYGMNNAGEVVGWSNVSGGTHYTFWYKDGNPLPLNKVTVGIYASARGINDSEQVVGQAGNGLGFSWKPGDDFPLTYPAFVTGAQSIAYGINKLGAVVGQANTSSTGYAVLYPPGEAPVNLNNLWHGLSSVARAINNVGQVVGEAATPNLGPFRAFRYDLGTKMKLDLGVIGGKSSGAYAINDSGQVVGDSEFAEHNCTRHAVLYSPGQAPEDLDPTGTYPSRATGINKLGQIVGLYNPPGIGQHAFIYENGSLHDLNNLLDSTEAKKYSVLKEATAINDRGQIVGNGVVLIKGLGYRTHGVLLTPVPVP